MNKSCVFQLGVQAKAAEGENNNRLFFTAITNIPIAETSFDNKKYKLTVDLETTKFEAKRFYKDHVKSVDSMVGIISDYQFKDRADGFKELSIAVDFLPEIASSKEVFQKYQSGLLDSVSIGLKDIDIMEDKQGNIYYQNGVIHEVSAVYDGRDPNAKLRDDFAKHISNSHAEFLQPAKEETVSDKVETTEISNKEETFDLDSKISKAIEEKMSSINSSIQDSFSKMMQMIEETKVKEATPPEPDKTLNSEIQLAKKTPAGQVDLAPIVNTPVQNFNINKPLTVDQITEIFTEHYGTANPDILDAIVHGKTSYGFHGKPINPLYTWNRGEQHARTFKIPDKYFFYLDDMQTAMDNDVKVQDVLMERIATNAKANFDVIKTTDIRPTIAEPRDTTRLWDVFKKYSAFINAVTTREQPSGTSYEYSIEQEAEFTMKGYDEGAQTEYQKYSPSKKKIEMCMLRMGVSYTYEALHTTDLNLKAHISQKMRKDMITALEKACFSGKKANEKFDGIFSLTGADELEKDSTFLKTPNITNYKALPQKLLTKFYNIENNKMVISPWMEKELKYTLAWASNPSSENVYLMKNRTIGETPVIVTNGLDQKEGLYGNLKTIILIYFCQGFDMKVFVEDNRDTKISIFMPVGMGVVNSKSLIKLTDK